MSKTILLKPLTLILASLLYLSSFAADSTFYFTTSDTVRLYVRVAGKGKPCLFVHGGPGSTSYYFEAFPGAAMIEEKMRMIYFDQRGSGRSDSARNKNYSLQRIEKDLEEIRTALGYKQWAVMGHSFGGIIITSYAAHHPRTVTALYMIHGTVNMQASMSSHLEFGLKEMAITDQIAFRDTTKALNERVWAVHEKLSERNLWYKLMYRNAAEKIINDSVTLSVPRYNRDFASSVWQVPEYWNDFAPLTATIKCPVLVITGRKDYAIGIRHYQSFHFPKQTTVHYIGGHASFQEEPQWFAEKILAFAAQYS